MVTIHNVEQGTGEWFKLREKKWTGSTIIHLLRGKGLPERVEFTSRYAERGKALEPQALTAYKLAFDRDYMSVGFVTNSDWEGCGYSPDGISGEILLEVKCFNGDRHKMLLAEEIPAEVMAQIQFGMLICELDQAQLIAYNPHDIDCNILHVIDIPRDEKIISNMKEKLKEAR